MLKLGAVIMNMLGVLSVFKICRNEVHGTGTIKGDNSYDIFEVMRLHVNHKRAYAAGFALEHAEGAAFAEHFIYFLIVNVYCFN